MPGSEGDTGMAAGGIVYRAHALSDTGLRRSRNEDSYGLHVPGHGQQALAVVADGVGGHPGGDIASRLAVNVILGRTASGLPGQGLRAWLKSAVLAANSAVRDARRHSPHGSMATTVVAMLASGPRMAVAHLGDSRAYRLRGGRLTRLTSDHTVAQVMFDEGSYNREDLARSPYHHILTRGVGLDEQPTCTCRQFEARAGDRYLLCSDGVNSVLPDGTIRRMLAQHAPLEQVAETLVNQANAGGGPDNITVIVVDCEHRERSRTED